MGLKKFIKTTIREYLNENYHFNNLKAYRGIGKNINKTYGGNDDGIGVFWTDNLTMAKWFAGLIDYNVNTDSYEDITNKGKILEKTLSFLNPYIINSDDEDYDYENGEATFTSYKLDDIKEWGEKNKDRIIINYSKVR
jgi:hypothetical protein